MEDANERETPLWERVKNLQEGNADELNKLRGIIGELEVMMKYNYGGSGRCIAGIVNDGMSLKEKLVNVLNYYDKIYHLNAEINNELALSKEPR